MARPCSGCEKWNGPVFVPNRDCFYCWSYHNRPAYRKHWDNYTPDIEIQPVSTQVSPDPIPVEQGPSWFQKMVNFSKAIVPHVWHGLPQTPTEEQEKRLAICLVCPSNLLDYNTGTCKHSSCGCSVAKKTRWLKESCPMNHW